MRNTKQNSLIFNIINNSYSHLDAYNIYELCKKEIPNISLGTVYRNLASLVNNHKIMRIKIDGIYRYDKNIRHSHFICHKCGCIIDIFDDGFKDIKTIDGNIVDDYEIKYKGICKKCMKGERK